MSLTYTIRGNVDPGNPNHYKGSLDDTRSLLKTTITRDLTLEGD